MLFLEGSDPLINSLQYKILIKSSENPKPKIVETSKNVEKFPKSIPKLQTSPAMREKQGDVSKNGSLGTALPLF